jgi:hypothetical protein
VPFVDGRVVLRPGIRTNPRGPSDLIPEVPRLDGLGDFAVDPSLELPIAVRLQRGKKTVGNRTLLFEFWPDTVW